jgi:hypothetical protein
VIPAHGHPVVEDPMHRARASAAQEAIHRGTVPRAGRRQIPLLSVPWRVVSKAAPSASIIASVPNMGRTYELQLRQRIY